MIQGILALLNWSLRIETRTFRPHALRLLFVLMIFFAMIGAHASSTSFGAPGLWFFSKICYLNLVIIILAGVSYFATAVSEEKESYTLSLLKMAGISPVAVLLGKSTSRLLGAVMLLLAQFPFTLLAITLGGVTFPQIIAAYVALFAFLVLLANLSLFCSVWCRSSGNAAGLTGLIVLGWLPSGYLADLMLRLQPAGPSFRTDTLESVVEFSLQTSIFPRLSSVLETGFVGTPFDTQFRTNLTAAGFFFLASWLIFESSTRDASEPVRPTPRSTVRLRRYRPSQRCWDNALIWKELYFLAGGARFQFCKLLAYIAIIGVIAYFGGMGSTGRLVNAGDTARTISIVMLIAIAVEASIYASRVFYDEVRWRSLESLLMLPVSTAKLAWSKAVACLIALIPGGLCLAVAFVLDPEDMLEFVSVPTTWFGVLTFVTFIHLTALFSLYVNWGALPLAAVVTAFFNFCCPMFSVGLTFMLAGFSGHLSLLGIPFMLFGLFVYWLVILFPIEHEIATRLEFLGGH